MRIGKVKLGHNIHTPYYIHDYIEKRMESLVRTVKKKIGDKYTVSYEKSRHSEACYLLITWEDAEEYREEVIVSFRNHDNFSDSTYDVAVWLSDFNTWTEMKSFFLNKILKKILEQDPIDYYQVYYEWQKETTAIKR